MGCAFCVLVLWCLWCLCVVCVVCCVRWCVCVWLCVLWLGCVVCLGCAVCVSVCLCACHTGHGRFERTHGSVLKVQTGAFSKHTRKRVIRLSLLSCVSYVSLFSYASLSLSAHVFFFLCFSLLSKTLSIAMTMVARPVGSLCTHGSILPEGQSAWALSPSLFGEVLCIMQKNCVGGVPVQASCHLE